MKSISEWWKTRKLLESLPLSVQNKMSDIKQEREYIKSEIRSLLGTCSQLSSFALATIGMPAMGLDTSYELSRGQLERVNRLEARLSDLKTAYNKLLYAKYDKKPVEVSVTSIAPQDDHDESSDETARLICKR